MESPKIARMVLFKHGVAFIERAGPAEGPFELSFRLDEMNDVLKSLAVWVARGDGTVGAIDFDKPEDPEEALQRRRLKLEPGAALQGILSSVRGRKITVHGRISAENQAATSIVGEVIGLENVPEADGAWRYRLLLRSADGRIVLVEINDSLMIDLHDPSSVSDLEYLIDRSRASTAGENRLVRVALSGRAEDLRVSYVIPAPIWRVSYRLATVDNEVMVMAWGVVHNPADEELSQIELTLTTGQPVSFMIDLYNPKTVKRTVVEESSRAASAPTQFERAPMAPPPPPARAAPAAPAMMGFGGPPGGAPVPQAAPMSNALASSTSGSSDYADRGEFFEYRVANKVTMKRGGSAMVPLVAKRVKADKERIWRVYSAPTPDLVLSFQNDTGAVLEEGPAVVYMDDVYAGEAMVPYTARGSKVRIAFAKDLAVRCKATVEQRTVVTAITVRGEFAVEESRGEQQWTLRAESDHRESVTVIFEVPIVNGRSWDSAGPQPFESTASYHRFKVIVPPHSVASISPIERWPLARNIRFDQMYEGELQTWFDRRFLDGPTVSHMRTVLEHQRRVVSAEQEITQRERERQEAYEKQSKISQQLNVLKEGGPEGELRMRYVRELAAAQDIVNQRETRIAQLRAFIETERAVAREKFLALTRT
jgi:hypothetical protein